MSWRAPSVALVIVTVLASVLVLQAERVTHERRQQARYAGLHEALRAIPMPPYDNDPVRERIVVADAGSGTVHARSAFPARHHGRPVGAFIMVSVAGYGGEMSLLVGVSDNGAMTGVRVIAHRETRGFGDRVLSGSPPWLHRFQSRTINDPVVHGWRLKQDGGEFDAVSGATITSRALVNAANYALEYFAARRGEIFSVR